MKMIAEKNELSGINSVGGKGSHLQKLVSWGAPVAPFFVLTTNCFRSYQKTQALPEKVLMRFDEFFKEHSKIALRSSMISEDHADASFAGLFETILDVTKENWKESLLKIYHSVNSERVQEYIKKKNLKVDLQMAVVVQEQIDVDKSGVLFTRSPVAPTATIAIDAAFGMGEGVVSGHSTVDHYQFTRLIEETKRLIQNDRPVLERSELEALIHLSLEMEKKSGFPSDLEWGIKDGKIFLFQIRPITRDFMPLTYYVDTNLSESYPGTVSPFTAAFVKKAYENVFKESAIIMGAKGEKLARLSYHYQKLISCVDDHLYYNLEHYYAVLRALPGGEKNIENWHRMIGGKMDQVKIPFHRTSLTPMETIQTIVAMLGLMTDRKKIFTDLLEDLERKKKQIEKKIGTTKNAKETIIYLHHLINQPLGFGYTVVNDVFVMMGLGFLTKLLKKKGVSEEAVVESLKTSEGVDSVKPLESFNKLISELSDEFLTAFSKCDLVASFYPYTPIYAELEGLGFSHEVSLVKKFLDEFGDRSFEELKLESLPLKNNPRNFYQLMSWAKKNPAKTMDHAANTQDIPMNWLEKKVLAFTQDAIAVREATRLWRGRYYHLLRQLVLKFGEQLQEESVEWREFSIFDFFSLSHEEWNAFAEDRVSVGEVRELILSRQRWQSKKRSYPEIIPWVESEELPQFDLSEAHGEMKGQGVSPGIIEGTALVLEHPNDALESELDNFILVTKNTDPAWVYIMSRSLGLISEKGSLLSHTAIIGRELQIPTIVGVRGATQKIKTGDKIKINATQGTIEFI